MTANKPGQPAPSDLPPRGVFVPVALVFNPAITASVFHTWVQLRALAWRNGRSPAIPMSDLSLLTGKSPSALYSHMALLRACNLLSWRSIGRGRLIVSFQGADFNPGGVSRG